MATFDFDLHSRDVAASLAVFCRAPRRGHVKTRLAKTHGETLALELYRAMLRDTFASGRALAPVTETFACFTPADAMEGELAALWPGAHLPQSEGDLGAKMLVCLAELRARGYGHVAVIGSDAPDLPLAFLQNGFAQLREFDVVVGPSFDGGFYFLGASRALPDEIFAGIEWSRDTVCARLQNNLTRLGLSYATLPKWRDVDDAADLDALCQRLESGQSRAPATVELLNNSFGARALAR